VTEFQSRRELREAERQGLVHKPEQVFDLPTGQIKLPTEPALAETPAQDVASVSEMLTRKRIREMEREGLLDPLTGALQVTTPTESAEPSSPETRVYDEVIAETEEPITASINAVPTVALQPENEARLASVTQQPIEATDIFHNMAVDVNARKPRSGILAVAIMVLLAGLGAAAYMLGIFK
jgi:hypothetical protein